MVSDASATELVYADELPRPGRAVDAVGVLTDYRYRAQKPYRNGVVVYTWSAWLGNGFGNATTKVAVLDQQIVAVYATSGHYRRSAYVLDREIRPDTGHTGHGTHRRPYTSRTALSKWIEAVKAL
ncbi:hypothetical protein [Mycolicibacterium sp.]|uniref:hypothetical protein n=1 Tax=Mycolicibacterium sp. TaxID=2320850 RepID=UPI00355F7857